MDVTILFRKKISEYYSIENVFNVIFEVLAKEISFRYFYAPTIKADPLSLMKNLFFFRHIKGEIFHVTGDIHYAVFAFPGKRTILTIHDAVFLGEKNPVKKLIFTWLWLKWPVSHSRFVTTISERSKEDILKYSHCDPSKIIVIPNPLDPLFIFSRQSFNADKPVLLQMGTLPNKNLDRVITAIEGINCHLLIIGKLSEVQINLLNAKKIDYSNEFFLSKEALIEKYRKCDMVMFVSTFEGFGLPVIEAQGTGRPLITSNIQPMKEVAGDAAYFADPFDTSSIRNGVLKIIHDQHYRQSLIEKGLMNVKRFAPEKIAMQYQELYKKVQNN